MPDVIDAPPPPPPAPTTTLRVSELPSTATPVATPKKGSAREGLFKDLRKSAKLGPPLHEPGDPEPAPAPSPPPTTPEPVPSPEPAPTPAEPAPAPTDGKDKKKVNPWALKDEWEKRAKAAEAKLLETEKRAVPEAQWKDNQTQLETARKRIADLEAEMRYVNYSKTDDYKVKYQVPYEQAWERAMGELNGLQVQDTNGDVRALQPTDIMELLNMPFIKAKQAANEKFGEYANDVMAHVRDIRKLFDSQHNALEEARKAGTEREQQARAAGAQASEAVRTEWNSANEEAQASEKYGRYFKPVDGDQEGNQRLAKGFEMADRAFAENPFSPGLSAEERKNIIQRHAAVRNRSAAFGRLVYQNGKLETELAELKKELAQYKGTEPDRSGSVPPVAPQASTSAMGRMFDELRKKGKPI